jgi:hypothetical protein
MPCYRHSGHCDVEADSTVTINRAMTPLTVGTDDGSDASGTRPAQAGWREVMHYYMKSTQIRVKIIWLKKWVYTSAFPVHVHVRPAQGGISAKRCDPSERFAYRATPL